MQEFAFMLMHTLQVLWMVVDVVPHMVAILAFMVFKCYKFYYYMQPAIKQSERLKKSTNGPILGLSKSTLNGMSVIRAFGKEKEFNDNFLNLLHQDILFSDLSNGIQAYD